MYMGIYDGIRLEHIAGLTKFKRPIEMRSPAAMQYAQALVLAFRIACVERGIISETDNAKLAAKRIIRQRSHEQCRAAVDIASMTTLTETIRDLGGRLPDPPKDEQQPERTPTDKRLTGSIFTKERVGENHYRWVRS